MDRIKFEYWNHRGEFGIRDVTIRRVLKKDTTYHGMGKTILEGFDHDKGEDRDFLLSECKFLKEYMGATNIDVFESRVLSWLCGFGDPIVKGAALNVAIEFILASGYLVLVHGNYIPTQKGVIVVQRALDDARKSQIEKKERTK